ncbi:hypothetical protein GQ54DRAFT_305414 [Martensiomyces pterosporus]|nr:hypothetical protein GQ54DRAFT_305414 [Martensiomyces pterosporus]
MKFAAFATALLAAAPFAAAWPKTYSKIAPFKDSWVDFTPANAGQTHGNELVLKAFNNKTAIIGFTLPSEATQAPNRLLSCFVTLPPFKDPAKPQNISVAAATANTWDEATVNGNNAPSFLTKEYTIFFDTPATGLRFNATELCKKAAAKGTGFSLYVASFDAPYNFNSRKTGKGALLDATVDNWAK